MEKELKIIQVKVKDIIPYKNNAKKHDQVQINNVAESIKQFGFRQPIVLDKDNVIIIGHCRWLASKKLKLDTIPCHYAEDLTEEQVIKLRNLDNKLNESEWDYDLLKDQVINIDFTGFDIDWGISDIETEPQEVTEDIPPEVDEVNEPICKLGDIWQLGNHYLGCGDSTDFLWLKTLMQGKKADLVFTDPPYGMKKEKDGVANDNLNFDDLLEFNKQWIPLTFDLLKDNGSWYCWGIDEPLMDIYSNILKPMQKENKITFRNLITWDKGNGQGQLSSEYRMYPIADEKCLFVMCGVQGFARDLSTWFDGFEKFRAYYEREAKKAGLTIQKVLELTNTYAGHYFSKSQYAFPTKEHHTTLQDYCRKNKINAFEKEYEEIKKEYEEIKKEYYSTRAYFDNTHDNMNNVWHFERTTGEEKESAGGHATPKPIALCGRAIKSSSRENEIVLDVFGGSGSTLIACEQLNRVCYANELDPHWCDVIINRWEQFTGKKAIKL